MFQIKIVFLRLQKSKLVLEDKIWFKKHIRFAFRILHIDNIPHVIKYGLVHNNSPFASDSYVPIGDMSVMLVQQSNCQMVPFCRNIFLFILDLDPQCYIIFRMVMEY